MCPDLDLIADIVENIILILVVLLKVAAGLDTATVGTAVATAMSYVTGLGSPSTPQVKEDTQARLNTRTAIWIASTNTSSLTSIGLIAAAELDEVFSTRATQVP